MPQVKVKVLIKLFWANDRLGRTQSSAANLSEWQECRLGDPKADSPLTAKKGRRRPHELSAGERPNRPLKAAVDP
jgi:hypothetical protein